MTVTATVRGTPVVTASSITSPTLTEAQTPNAGNLLVIPVASTSSSVVAPTMAISNSTKWTAVTPVTGNNSTNQGGVWLWLRIADGSADDLAPTLTAGTGQETVCTVVEWTPPVGYVFVLDSSVSGGTRASAGVLSTSSFTPGNATELLIAATGSRSAATLTTWIWQNSFADVFTRAFTTPTTLGLGTNNVQTNAAITPGVQISAPQIACIAMYGVKMVQTGFAGAAGLSGNGSLSASGVPGSNGSASFSGAGTLTASGVPAETGAASLSGVGTLAASAATVAIPGAAGLAGTGTLAAGGSPSVPGAAGLSGAGSLTASASPQLPTTATLAGTGTLSASGAPGSAGAASLAGVGTLAASATPSVPGGANLAGSGTLSASGKPAAPSAANLTGTGTLNASGAPAVPGAANLGGAGTLTATSTIGTATFSGTGILTAGGSPHVPGVVTFTGLGVLSCSGVSSTSGAAGFAGVGTLSAVGFVPTPPSGWGLLLI